MSMFSAGSIIGDIKLQTRDWTRSVRQVLGDTQRIRMDLRRIASDVGSAARTVAVFGTALGGALALAGRSFLRVADTTEQYRVRLQILLRSQAEGNRLFQEMAVFAGRVPHEFEAIMGSATKLAGIMKGGVDEISAWMPLISDLAVAAGLSISETTDQVVRMLAAGANSADLFRERGVLAMLGFQAGVSISAKETREQLINEWTKADSQFRGASEKLADTWSGQLSMMSDKWFAFRDAVMSSGLFQQMKDGLAILNRVLDQNRERIEEWIRTHGDMISKVIIGTAAFAGLSAVFLGLSFILPQLVVVMKGFSGALQLILLGIPQLLSGIAKTQVGLTAMGGQFTRTAVQAVAAWAAIMAPATALVAALATIGVALYSLRALWNRNFYGMRDTFKDVVDAIGIGWDVIASNVYEVITFWRAQWNSLMDFLGVSVAKFQDVAKPVLRTIGDAWDFNAETMRDAFSVVKAQFGEDMEAIEGMAREKFPRIFQMFEELRAGLAATGDAVAPAALPDFSQFPAIGGGAQSVAGGGGAASAMTEQFEELEEQLKSLADTAPDVWERIQPPSQRVFAEMAQDLAALIAAGRFEGEADNLLARHYWPQLADLGGNAIKGVIQRLRDLGPEAAKVADELLKIWDGLKADRGRTFLDSLLGLSGFEEAKTQLAELGPELQKLVASGEITDDNLNIMAESLWDRWRNFAPAAVQELIGSLREVHPELATLVEDLSKQEDGIQAWASEWREAGAQISQIGRDIGNEVVTKLGSAINAVTNLVAGLKELPAAFKAMKDGFAALNAAAMANAFLAIVAAVIQLVDAFGLFGDKTEEVKEGFARVMDEIKQKWDEWADRLTDTLVEFVKTGQASFKELVDSILEDILRLAIRYGVVEPIFQAAGGLFAKGAAFQHGQVMAFAGGGVIGGPTLFPMAGGKVGLMGEAGPEAIMPLKRMPGGRLGVAADSGGVVVNIHDNRTGGAPIDVTESVGPDGQRVLDILVQDAVRRGVRSGALDPVFGQTFGLRRRPR